MRGGRVKGKTAHSLRVTCVSPLFISGVEEKLIRERSGGVTKTKTYDLRPNTRLSFRNYAGAPNDNFRKISVRKTI